MNKYDSLFTPFKIGNCEIKNRFVLEPMEGTNIIDWLQECKFRGEEVHDYYIARAKNNVGLIIPGMIPLRSMIMSKWLPDHPEVFKDVRPLLDEIHSYGAKVFFQIGAGWGRSLTAMEMFKKINDHKLLKFAMKPILNMDKLLIAASENPNRWNPEIIHRAITEEEIHEFVEGYATVAKFCQDAGVDGVEVHAVHEGYLLDEFTTKYTNQRTDAYGGSFENRYRFAVEVIEAIRRKCGDDYPVSIRFSVTSKTKGFGKGAVPQEDDYVEAGRDLEEGIRAAKYLQEAGYDMLNADNGTYDAWYWAHPPVYMPLNCNIKEAMAIKAHVDIAVVCAGRMQPDKAAEAIQAGQLDGIGIGRQFLTDPEFVNKVREDRLEDVLPCISCHNACLPVALVKGKGVALDSEAASTQGHCALNPVTFSEKKYRFEKTANPRKISIIGGGIGGMSAAYVLKQRGYEPVIYEKSQELGGVFIAAAAPDFKEKDKEVIAWYQHQMEKLHIEIHYGAEIKDLRELDTKEVIVATGAKPRMISIPGCEPIEAIEYLRGTKTTGDHVAVIGGGLTGCEIAYDLALKGKHPVIVEMQDDILKSNTLNMANSSCLMDLLEYYKVPIYVNSKVKQYADGKLTILTSKGEMTVACDSIITSCGYISGSSLISEEAMKKLLKASKKAKKAAKKEKVPVPVSTIVQDKEVYVLGDAMKVGNLKTVIWGAYDLACALS